MKHAKPYAEIARIGKTVPMLVAAILLIGLLPCCQTTRNVLPSERFITERFPVNVEIKDDKYRLDGLMIRPKGDGPFPLVVLTHGTCGKSCRQKRSPEQLHAQANVFARWGYAAFVLMRRGNGSSDGPYAEDHGGCKIQNYEQAARATADDIRAAILALDKQAFIDPERVIAVGQSGGGIGVVALAASAPPGLRAAINFAGGRGSSCIRRGVFKEKKLADAYRSFGQTAHIPTLWLYSQNDGHWLPEMTRGWRDEFAAGGGAKVIDLDLDG